jgi:hypothetical protein
VFKALPYESLGNRLTKFLCDAIFGISRYYTIATPGATERLLLGLLEAPPAGVPHGLLVAVALLDILRVAYEGSSSVQVGTLTAPSSTM